MNGSFWHGKKVLVAGGAGFIGSYLTEALVDLGAHVRVADNLERGKKENLANVWGKIEFQQLDLTSPANCRLATDGMDAVFNLAARACGLEYSMSHHGEMLTHNTLMGYNILEAARQKGVDRVLVVSTSCVYSDDAPNPIVEDAFRGEPERVNRGYALGKIALETQAKFYAADYGMKIAIARPNNAYGPRDVWDADKAHVIPALIKRVLDGQDPVVIWGSGRQTRAFVHVRDIVQGLLLLLEKYPTADPINVGHEREITIADLAKMICSLAGKTPSLLFDSSKPEGALRKSLSSAKLKQVTGGFAPNIRVEHGLGEMIEWYRQHLLEATQRSAPLLSIITPVYCEDELITATISEVKQHVSVPYEMLVVYDFDEDTTLPFVRQLIPEVPELALVKNELGRGAINAIRSGILRARGEYVVVVNGDLSDDMSTINKMVEMAQQGFDVVCGSRYSAGGKKLGGPFIQDLLSRVANATFHFLTRFPTRDVTNSFKLYRSDFLRSTPIVSSGGFEFSTELAIKARARNQKIGEVPTVWKQRKSGESRFLLWAWLKNYLKWYFLGVSNAWFRTKV